MNEPSEGRLILIATPIGNLGDFPPRALDALHSATLILAEDTRVSRKLLPEGVRTPWRSYREETEQRDAPELAALVASGETICLLSDAGTPAISDPGFRLVRECRRLGLEVTAIPGPNAALMALSISGLPTHAFLFAGFLPPKSSARRRFFLQHAEVTWTLVLYESPHRIGKFLDDATEVFGEDRYASIARELTKRFETVQTARLGELRSHYPQTKARGEFVVCIAPVGYQL